MTDMQQFTKKILLPVMAAFIFQNIIKAQCGVADWGTLLANGCGNIQASGGLAAGSPVIFCEGETVTVENNSSPASEIDFTYIDWGDGYCQELPGFHTAMTHTYDFPNDTCIISSMDGTLVYNARLGVKKVCGNLTSFHFIGFSIKVGFKPIARFSVNNSASCVDQTFIFTNTSCENSDNPSFFWNFGDGTTSTEENPPPHSYSSTGIHTVTLTVTNNCGTSTYTQILTVLPASVASFNLPANPICVGQSITIENTSLNANAQYWFVLPHTGVSFVPPTSASSFNPEILFNSPGVFTIKLNVYGCGNPSATETITVLAPAGIQLADEPDGCANQPLQTNPVAAVSGDNPLVNWSFPGGSPAFATGNDPGIITYSGQGTYIITAVATNFCGTVIESDTFLLLPPATAQVTLSADTLCAPDTLSLINSSAFAFSVDPYAWTISPDTGYTFVDGTDSTSTAPRILFTQEGTYTLRLQVHGCGNPVWESAVVVMISPGAALAMVQDECVDFSIDPSDYATLDHTLFATAYWNFGGGTPTSFSGLDPGPVLFSGFGAHFISVTIANGCGIYTAVDSFLISPVASVDLPSAGPFCSADNPFQLLFDPPGGSWSGAAVTAGGLFSPGAAPLNDTTQLIYTVGIGSCEAKDSLAIYVKGTHVEAGSDLALCADHGILALADVTPSGGYWAGTGVTSAGVFDPGISGLGAFELTYAYYDSLKGCTDTDALTVTVSGIPSASLNTVGRKCVGESIDFSLYAGGTDIASCFWQFGDGATSSDCTPSHAYAAAGYYTVSYLVENAAGCRDTATAVVQVVTPPDAQFTTDTTSGCADLSVAITNTSSINDYTNFIWDLGNGVLDTLPFPGSVVFTQGETDTTYTLRLRAINGCGEAFDSVLVTVFPRPQVRFGPDISNGCTPLEVNFNNVSVGNPDSFNWFINGNLVGNGAQLGQQILYTADHDSIYTVVLVAENECGLDTAVQTITVKPNPVTAFFNIDTLQGCAPLEIRLVDYSTAGLYVHWDLGNGYTAIGDTVVHTYFQSGHYVIREFVNNGCGFDTAEVSITVFPAPMVGFSHDPTICLGDTLFFQNTSQALSGNIWDFGDGMRDSTQISPQHIYQNPGVYAVQLTGFAATTGCPATFSASVEVKPLPTLDVQLKDSFGCQPFTLQSINSNPAGTNNFYVWDFGDGSTGTGAPISHDYPVNGAYPISVTITDFFGCKNAWDFPTVQVFPKPEAAFSVNQAELCVTPAIINFHNESNEADAWVWDFGPLGNSTLVHPSLVVAQSGPLDIALFAQNQYGCRDTLTRSWMVYTKPVLDAFTEDPEGCAAFTAVFDNLSMGVNSFHWDFGDGGTSREQQPAHTYAKPGLFTVTLHAAQDSVCFDSLTLAQTVTVHPSPVAGFTYTTLADTSITPNGIFEFTDTSVGAIRWHWDFGDGDTAAVQHPAHRYYINGTKTVQLIVWNAFGCTDTTLVVLEPDFFGNLYIPNALSPESGVPGEMEFKPTGLGLMEFEIEIFASNGQRVWHSNALTDGQPAEAWNGRLNNAGAVLPQGLYWWKARARSVDGQLWKGMVYHSGESPVMEGKVMLLR